MIRTQTFKGSFNGFSYFDFYNFLISIYISTYFDLEFGYFTNPVFTTLKLQLSTSKSQDIVILGEIPVQFNFRGHKEKSLGHFFRNNHIDIIHQFCSKQRHCQNRYKITRKYDP